MPETSRPFQLVEDDQPEPAQAPQPALNRISTEMLIMALGALSKRFIVALSNLLTGLAVGSAFFLWWSTPDPNAYQIVSLTIYAMFILAIIWLARRK